MNKDWKIKKKITQNTVDITRTLWISQEEAIYIMKKLETGPSKFIADNVERTRNFRSV